MKKSMKKLAMKKSQIAKGKLAKSVVFRGTKDKLIRNKRGKVVSKAASVAAKKRASHIIAFAKAVQAARKALGITGFCPVNGKTAQGKALYAKAKAIYGA